MAGYKLVFKRSLVKDLRALPKKDVERILTRIRGLSHDPRPPAAEKLSGQERYRIRQGRYRIIYEVEDDRVMVVVVKVAHRGEVYK